MEKIENNVIINEKILQLWNENPEARGNLMPLLYSEFKKNGFLFIGINPSYGKKAQNKNLTYEDITDEKINETIEFENKFVPGVLFNNDKNDEKVNQLYPYYKKPTKLAKEIDPKLNVQFIDLYQKRKTNQKEIESEINLYPEFFDNQLEITKEIVSIVKPKIIVVINAKASDTINAKWEIKKESKTCLYYYNKIPIFFSGMLSSQRALDNYNYERLKWHIHMYYQGKLDLINKR